MDLNLGIISEVEKKLKKKLLIDYLYSNLKHHNFWCYRYFFCEVLSLVNVCGKYGNSYTINHEMLYWYILQYQNASHIIIMFHFRTNGIIGPLFWRYLFHIRHWSDVVCRPRPRRSDWSDDLRLPADDKMHVPQIWNVWQHRETRRAVYSTPQYSQRKNIYLYLVLAIILRPFIVPYTSVSGCHNILTIYSSLCSSNALSKGKARMCRNGKILFRKR